MIRRILSHQHSSILSAALVIMVCVCLSRLLGLTRDRMLAARFTPEELGVYFAAFRLPNLVFELLVMGALSTAFIPVFTFYLTKKEEKEAMKVASSVMNLGFLLFLFFSLPIVIFTREISRFLAPGFNEQQLTLMVSFTRIMVLAQVFPLIFGNFLTGILQSYKSFLIPSLAPVIYNVGIILGILFLTPFYGLYGPVFGVVLGAFLFMLIQIPTTLSFGYRHFALLDLSHPGVREVGKLMLPRTLGLAVSQIDTTVDLILSTLLGARAVTIFNFAQHLQQVPIGLFGATIAQAALPTLTREKAKENLEEFKNTLLSSFHQILFLVLPLSVILIVLRIPSVRLVFGASRFDWQATVLTGKTLAFFAISIFAQAEVQLLARGFYALYDSRTPVLIGVFSVFLNTILSILFIQYFHFPVFALGLSTSIASLVNFLLLLFYLDKKVARFDKIRLFLPAIKMFLAAGITAVFLYVPMKLLDKLVFDTTRTLNLLLLTGIATSIGLSVYLFLAWFLDVEEVKTFVDLVKRVGKLKQLVFETQGEMINGKETKI